MLSVVGTNKTANDTINTIVLAPMDSISIKSSVVAGTPVVPSLTTWAAACITPTNSNNLNILGLGT